MQVPGAAPANLDKVIKLALKSKGNQPLNPRLTRKLNGLRPYFVCLSHQVIKCTRAKYSIIVHLQFVTIQ